MSKKSLLIFLTILLVALGISGFVLFNQTVNNKYNYPLLEEKVIFEEPEEEKIMEMMKKDSPRLDIGSSDSKQVKEIIQERKYSQFVPKFTEVKTDYTHKYSKDSVQFSGGSLVDIDNNGVDEVFVCGGLNQDDGLMFFENNSFVNKIQNSGLSNKITCYGSFGADLNDDGFTDLLVAREDGVYQYINQKNRQFSSTKLEIQFEQNTIPVNISGGDINNDGVFDLYISTFPNATNLLNTQFNNDGHARANILLQGKGDSKYDDITQKSGTYFDENTFITTFVDLNNDNFQDIVIAPDTSRMIIYKNNGNSTFTKLEPVSENGFWMGLALGDTDNDGDIDIFATNVGNTIPTNFLKGDLGNNEILDPKWRMLRNDGNFKFVDITKESKLDNYEFAWGAVFEDFNLDNILDLSVMENYIKWPAHTFNKLPGRFFVGTKSGAFQPTTKDSGVENPNYGMTPLTSDFNNDGYPDLVNINLEGPVKAFINKGGENKSFKIELPTTAKYINAKIIVALDDGKVVTRQYIPSQGLAGSQSNKIIIPLAKDHNITKLEVKLTNGETKTFDNIKLGNIFKIPTN